MVILAVRAAEAIGAGHVFVVFLREGYPVNVLNPIKAVPEVCTVFCATADPVEILVARTGQGIVGAVDGAPPLGVETAEDAASRRDLLRAIGYKLSPASGRAGGSGRSGARATAGWSARRGRRCPSSESAVMVSTLGHADPGADLPERSDPVASTPATVHRASSAGQG